MENKKKNKYSKRKTDEKSNPIELGMMQHLPPQAIDLEEAVLGAILLEPSCLTKVSSILTNQEMFYGEEHKLIYLTMLELANNFEPIDILTVTNKAKEIGLLQRLGGPHKIAMLTSRVASSANVEFHSRIIVQKFISRAAGQVGAEIANQSFDESVDVFDLLELANSRLIDIANKSIRTKEKNSTSIFKELNKQLEIILASKDGEVNGVPSGLKDLDNLTNGFQKSDLIILAARPAVGKTALVKNILNGAMNIRKKPIGLFSLEMSATQQILRIISEEIGVPSNEITRKDRLKEIGLTAIQNVYTKLVHTENNKTTDLYIVDDSPGLSMMELRAKARRMKTEHDIQIIAVDYLQLIGGETDSQNRQVEVAKISVGLKNLAKELDIPVIALSQLTRSVESSPLKKPNLSHLKDSGAIEAAADVVMFLWRPEYYFDQGDPSFAEVEHCKTGQMISSRGYAELIISKHRNGSTGPIPLRFIGSLTKFDNWDSPQPQQNNYNIQSIENNDYASGKSLLNIRNTEFDDHPF